MNLTRSYRYPDNVEQLKINRVGELSICTYNILADCHIAGEKYHTEQEYLYRNNDECSYRHKLLLRELDFLSSEVVLLQEVDEEYEPIICKDMTSRGYECSFKCKGKPIREGIAICYKKEKFQCLRTSEVLIHDEIKRYFSAENIDISQCNENIKKEHVFQVCVLKDQSTGTIIIVGNIHIVYEEYKQPVLQALQACTLFNYIHNLRIQTASKENIKENLIPVIICGDFNMEPCFDAISLIKNGRLSKEKMEELKHLTYKIDNGAAVKTKSNKSSPCVDYLHKYLYNSVDVRSAYETVLGEEPLITSSDGEVVGTLDYIFYTSNVSVSSVLHIDESLVKEYSKGGPNENFSSDHLPIKATFIY